MTDPTPAEPSTRRSDARRNRERILAAARASFAGGTASPSMAEISRTAGVGMATLYRNFPTRSELLEALYAAEAERALADAADRAGAMSPGDALRAWLREFFAFAASKKHIAAELLTHVPGDSPIFADTRTRVIATGTPLFAAAQDAGEVRADLTLEQVLTMLVSLATIDGDADYRDPILRTVLDGLTPRATGHG